MAATCWYSRGCQRFDRIGETCSTSPLMTSVARYRRGRRGSPSGMQAVLHLPRLQGWTGEPPLGKFVRRPGIDGCPVSDARWSITHTERASLKPAASVAGNLLHANLRVAYPLGEARRRQSSSISHAWASPKRPESRRCTCRFRRYGRTGRSPKEEELTPPASPAKQRRAVRVMVPQVE